MNSYDFNSIEAKWQKEWLDNAIYKTEIDQNKPKFYALDMFPYPSGAGLHVGHPLGYIASDIVSRYKRLNGFNVLHPMGFDAFGLPAEQYAIQTGQHPAVTTAQNLARYKEQLNRIGFSFDWSREIQTCDPNYYKWTQWIFIQLFESWYNKKSNKAESINHLISIFEHEGNVNVNHSGDDVTAFTSEDWEKYDEKERAAILQAYRLAFQKETTVNWCEELGTVLANDEVKDGLSERGGYPVTQKLMKQWYLRISAYADRLLDGLNTIEWSDSIKEMQRNWIGRSEGALMNFRVAGIGESYIQVFTTRPDTIFGCTFMVLAPDHELVSTITTAEQRQEVETYAKNAANKSERERMINKEVSGVFTGGYAIHPFTHKKVPVYISEYVLSGYGTGAIMAVPAHDERDFAFATKFKLDIIEVVRRDEKQNGMVVRGDTNHNDTNHNDTNHNDTNHNDTNQNDTNQNNTNQNDTNQNNTNQNNTNQNDTNQNDTNHLPYDAKDGRLMNSENFDRLTVKEGMQAIIQLAEERGFGCKKVNYKLRDAGYSRQRYWGEPFPIFYENGVPTVDHNLPVTLPEVKSYQPTGTGESPLASNTEWVNTPKGRRETDTMPGYAGSSWYFLRYMDPNNSLEFAGKESLAYWNQVDLYIGGTEHATGHLLYSRFWTKFLYDVGYLNFEEPFKKLVNQGMIQGESMLLNTGEREIHIPIELATKDATISTEKLDELKKKDNRLETLDITTLDAKDGFVKLRTQVEKMSKSKYNVVNPDDVCAEYGADTLRLYEMFLGPLEDSKPWSTKGIDGTFRFLKKLWALFYNQDGVQLWNESEANTESLKTLHKTIKKITEDIENFSFNTSIAQFMICVNELGTQKCTSKSVLEKVLVLLAPFAPHITEELWHKVGHSSFIADATWPVYDPSLLVESTKEYPISVNGKARTSIEFSLDMSKEEIEKAVLADEIVQKWLEGKAPKKVIVVPGKIVNVVV